jgi:hypothetical protein
MRIWTSRYSNPALVEAEAVKVGVTVGTPRWKLPYQVAWLREVAPYGLLAIEDGDEFRTGYRHRLHRQTVAKIRAEFERISAEHDGQDLILLCFEDVRREGESCHRTLFGEWWQEQTGEQVEEWPDPSEPKPVKAKAKKKKAAASAPQVAAQLSFI